MAMDGTGRHYRNNKPPLKSWGTKTLICTLKRLMATRRKDASKLQFSKLSLRHKAVASSLWSILLLTTACVFLANGQRFQSGANVGDDDDFSREDLLMFAVAGHYFNRSLVDELEAFDPRIFSDGDIIKVHFPRRDFPALEWLIYLPDVAALHGVPLPAHAGPNNFYVTVDVVHANASSQSAVTLPCTVEVLTEERAIEMRQKLSRFPKLKIDAPRTCSYRDPVTIAMISLEAESQHLSHHDRSTCVRNFITFFDVRANDVTFHSAMDSLRHYGAILSGLGNVPKTRTQPFDPNVTAALSWTIGCSSDFIGDMPALDKLEETALDGSLARAIVHDVSEWQVVNVAQHFEKKVLRMKRKVGTIPSSATIFYPPSSKLLNRRRDDLKTMNFLQTEETVSTFSNVHRRVAINAIRATPVVNVPIIAARISSSPLRRSDHGFPLSTPLIRRPGSALTTGREDSDEAPMVLFGMDHVNAGLGTYMQIRIPNDVFYDSKDKMTWDLKLTLMDAKTKEKIPDGKSWLMFDADSQLLYGVPDDTAVKEREVALYAMDSGGKSASVTFYVRVDVSDAPDPASHKFTFYFSKFPDLESDSALYSAFGRKLTLNMAGTEFTSGRFVMVDTGIARSPGRRFVTWFDKSLSRKDSCQSMAIKDEADVMIGEDAKAGRNLPARGFANKFKPEFELKAITIELLGPCIEHTTTTTTTTTTTLLNSTAKINSASATLTLTSVGSLPSSTPSQVITNNLTRPSLQQRGKPLPVLLAQAGNITRFTFPSGSFVAAKSSEPLLDIILLAGAPSWIAVVPKTNVLYLVPTADDLASLEAHNSTYRKWTGDVVARNANGATSKSLAVKVLIQRRRSDAEEKANHKFSVVITNYDVKNFTALDQVRLIRTIVDAFGDSDSTKLYFYPIRKGSVVFSWHNSSLAYIDPCPFGRIAALGRAVFDGKKFKSKAKEIFRAANFTVKKISLSKPSWCIAGREPVDTKPAVEDPKDDVAIAGRQGKSTTIIVVAMIALSLVVLVVILVVKCRTSRASKAKERREKAKLVRQEATECPGLPDKTRIKKGVPIVFHDEIEPDGVAQGSPATVLVTNRKNGNSRNPTTAERDDRVLEEMILTRPHPRHPLTPPTPVMSSRPPPPYVKSQ